MGNDTGIRASNARRQMYSLQMKDTTGPRLVAQAVMNNTPVQKPFSAIDSEEESDAGVEPYVYSSSSYSMSIQSGDSSSWVYSTALWKNPSPWKAVFAQLRA